MVGAPVTAIMIGKLSEGDVRWKSSAIFAPLQSEQCKSVFEPLAVVMRYDLYFKLDDDTIVNWRIALPRMLSPFVTAQNLALPLKALYVGTRASNQSCSAVRSGAGPCAVGALYGFSRDVIEWVLMHIKPAYGKEDMIACSWARAFERQHKRLDARGLLDAGAGLLDNAWVHPVKDDKLYRTCVSNWTHGCQVVMFAHSPRPLRIKFKVL